MTPLPSETPEIPETCGTPEPTQAQREVWSAMQQNQTRAGPGGSLLRLAADIGAHSGIDATGTLVTIAKTYRQMRRRSATPPIVSAASIPAARARGLAVARCRPVRRTWWVS